MTDLVVQRTQRLRAEFDRSFTEPLRRLDAAYDELLAIQAGGYPYAIRLTQTVGVHPDRAVTALPSPLPALLGVAGFGGTLIPVYDLGALLGHPSAQQPRWLILAAGSPPLGLAFHQLERHVRVPSDSIVTEGAAGTDTVRGMVPLADGTRPIIDLPATRAAVHRLTGHRQEQRT